MGKKCPNCGKDTLEPMKSNPNRYMCQNPSCHRTYDKREIDSTESKPNESKGNWFTENLKQFPQKIVYLVLIGVILVAEYLILQFILPQDIRDVVFSSIEAGWNAFLSTLKPFLEGNPLATTILGTIPFAIIIAVTLLLIFGVSSESLKAITKGLFIGVIIAANLLLGIFFAIGSVTGGTEQLVCYAKTGFLHPETCYTSSTPTAPPVKKTGCESNPQACYSLLDINWGNAHTPTPFEPPTLYANDKCIVDASIQNVAFPARIVDGIVASGKIRDSECELKGGCVKLIPESCTSDSPCSIPVSPEPTTVTLDCDNAIPFKANTFVDAIFYASYPILAQGSNDYYIFSPSAQINLAQPETSPGPVDITVFFTPNYLTTTSNAQKIRMYIQIENKQSGQGFLQSIKVARIAEFPELGDAVCHPQSDSTQTWNENDWYNLKTDISGKVIIICDMTINGPLQLPPQVASTSVKFFAYINYIYTQQHLESVKILNQIS